LHPFAASCQVPFSLTFGDCLGGDVVAVVVTLRVLLLFVCLFFVLIVIFGWAGS